MKKRDLDALDPLHRAPVIRKTRTFVRLPVVLKNELERRAAKRKVSLNAMIIHACVDHCRKRR
jgi:predicted HicB family RNase H-like nuclease